MRLFSLFSVLSLIWLLAACGSGAEEPAAAEETSSQLKAEKELYDQMMAVHDEVMPRMGELNRISRSLKEYRENHPEMTDATRQRIEQAIEQLEAADEGMMSWMGTDRKPETLRSKDMEHQAIMDYLKKEEAAIRQVKQDMEQSMENGRQLLEQLNPEKVNQ